MKKLLFYACLVLAACLSAACSTPEGEKPDEKPVETSQDRSSFAPAELFDAYATWLPSDAIAVAVGDPGVLWEFAGAAFPPGEAGAKHFELMKADLDRLFAERLGFSPTSAKAVVIGGGPTWQVAIFHGDVDFDLGDATVEADGLTAHRVDFAQVLQSPVARPMWFVPLDNPKGLAVFPSKQAFEAAAAARAASASTPAPAASLASGAERDAFNRLFEKADGRFVLAVNLAPKFQRNLSGSLPFPSPHAAVLSLGGGVNATIIGEKASLDGLETLVEQYREQILQLSEKAYSVHDQRDTPEAAGSIASYHMMQAYNEALTSERGDDSLTYIMPVPRHQLAVAFIGIGAAIAVPAFLKYIKRSKASEADAILGRMQHQAEAYYMQSGADGDCNFPPSAGPSPPQKSCCAYHSNGEGGQRCPANPEWWDQEGWRALDVELSDPTYFSYEMLNESSEGGDDTLVLRAYSDFECGGELHTVEVRLTGVQREDGTCEAEASPRFITNEFE